MSRLPGFSVGPAAPVLLQPTSTADQVIAVVNQNTARVHSYATNNASISVPGLPNLPLAQGNIAFQRPNNFRFQARAITGPEVDFGSNAERFWLWAKQMRTPDGRSPLYTVRHDQYATSGAQNMMPVEPQWIIDALGLITIDPANVQPPTPRPDGSFEVRSVEQGPRGALTRVLIINSQGQVTQQSVVNAQGMLLASATAERFQYDPQTQVSLPRVVTVRAPEADLALKIDVGTLSVNGAVGDPNVLFRPPPLQNHPIVDLGAAAVAPANWNAPAATTMPQPQAKGFQTPEVRQPFPQPAPASVYQIPAGGVALPAPN